MTAAFAGPSRPAHVPTSKQAAQRSVAANTFAPRQQDVVQPRINSSSPRTFSHDCLRERAEPRRGIKVRGRKAAKVADRKGKTDAARSKVYGKYGKMVLTAALKGGPSPASNAELATVVESAKRAGVPRDLIDRNIKRASEKDAAGMEEQLIEVYGPGGSAFIMDCMTDNKQRASDMIWGVVRKCHGKMADSGSVLFNFQRRGEIVLEGCGEDAAFEAAVEAGADDVEPHFDEDGNEAGFKVVCSSEDYGTVRDALRDMSNVSINEGACRLSFKALAEVDVQDDEKLEDNIKIFDRCLELTDVDAIYTNCVGVGAGT